MILQTPNDISGFGSAPKTLVDVFISAHCPVCLKTRVVISVLPFLCLMLVATHLLNCLVLVWLLGEGGGRGTRVLRGTVCPQRWDGRTADMVCELQALPDVQEKHPNSCPELVRVVPS